MVLVKQHLLVTTSSKIIDKDSARAGILILIPKSSTNHKSKRHTYRLCRLTLYYHKKSYLLSEFGRCGVRFQQITKCVMVLLV
jgi:hypothetical protein